MRPERVSPKRGFEQTFAPVNLADAKKRIDDHEAQKLINELKTLLGGENSKDAMDGKIHQALKGNIGPEVLNPSQQKRYVQWKQIASWIAEKGEDFERQNHADVVFSVAEGANDGYLASQENPLKYTPKLHQFLVKHADEFAYKDPDGKEVPVELMQDPNKKFKIQSVEPQAQFIQQLKQETGIELPDNFVLNSACGDLKDLKECYEDKDARSKYLRGLQMNGVAPVLGAIGDEGMRNALLRAVIYQDRLAINGAIKEMMANQNVGWRAANPCSAEDIVIGRFFPNPGVGGIGAWEIAKDAGIIAGAFDALMDAALAGKLKLEGQDDVVEWLKELRMANDENFNILVQAFEDWKKDAYVRDNF